MADVDDRDDTEDDQGHNDNENKEEEEKEEEEKEEELTLGGENVLWSAQVVSVWRQRFSK